ncbi:MAG: hypothetical protein Q8O76_14485 [Chloroflexota bacterium]|nr:hypothetical protein [Chloroflexota bacterium]
MHPMSVVLALATFWTVSAVGVALVALSVGGLRRWYVPEGAFFVSRLRNVKEQVALTAMALLLLAGLFLIVEGGLLTYRLFYTIG